MLMDLTAEEIDIYRRIAYRVAKKIVNHDDAMDCAQDAVIALITHAKDQHNHARITFVARASRNKAIDMLRRIRTRDGMIREPQSHELNEDLVCDRWYEMSDNIDASLLIHYAKKHMSNDELQTLEHMGQGLTDKEIGSLLGLKTAKSRIYRMRARLARIMGE